MPTFEGRNDMNSYDTLYDRPDLETDLIRDKEARIMKLDSEIERLTIEAVAKKKQLDKIIADLRVEQQNYAYLCQQIETLKQRFVTVV